MSSRVAGETVTGPGRRAGLGVSPRSPPGMATLQEQCRRSRVAIEKLITETTESRTRYDSSLYLECRSELDVFPLEDLLQSYRVLKLVIPD